MRTKMGSLSATSGVIPIDDGRQLFVDDFLIEQTTLQRTFHLPRYHPDGPVLKAETPCEFHRNRNIRFAALRFRRPTVCVRVQRDRKHAMSQDRSWGHVSAQKSNAFHFSLHVARPSGTVALRTGSSCGEPSIGNHLAIA